MASALNEAIQSLIARDNYGTESLVVPAHVQQIVLWMVRQGLEFIPRQDTPDGSRRRFLEDVVKANKLPLYYSGIASLFLLTGGILWYIYPTVSGYGIYWFHSGKENNSGADVPSQYLVFYAPGGRELQEAIVRYPFVDYGYGNAAMLQMPKKERWIRMRIRPERIMQELFDECPPLNPYAIDTSSIHSAPREVKEYANSFGFVPCVESPNRPYLPGEPGKSDFNLVANQVEVEDGIRSAILANIFTFGNPTLVTSRPVEQVLTSLGDAINRINMVGDSSSWAASQGFRSIGSNPFAFAPLNRNGMKSWSVRSRERIAPIIGNVDETERFGYIYPDPVSPDQTRFADQYRSAIHASLGGIDPLDTSFSTFGEVKSLFGKVAATALEKSRSLWEYGLCSLLSMAILAEEQLFADRFKWSLSKVDPKIKVEEVTDEQISILYFDRGVRFPGLSGLCPYGTREVKWRHQGPVFEDSPEDKLQRTIYCRNLQELGVGSLEALDEVFPDLSEEEKRAMLTGIPFRTVNQYIQIIGQMLGLQQQMLQTPDVQDPGTPMAIRFDLSPYIEKVMAGLARELSYGSSYDDADPNQDPRTNHGTSQLLTSTESSGGAVSDTADGTSIAGYDWANVPIVPGATIRTRSPGTGMGGGWNPNGTGLLRPAAYANTTLPVRNGAAGAKRKPSKRP